MLKLYVILCITNHELTQTLHKPSHPTAAADPKKNVYYIKL